MKIKQGGRVLDLLRYIAWLQTNVKDYEYYKKLGISDDALYKAWSLEYQLSEERRRLNGF